MADYKWIERFLPVDVVQILADALPEGHQWYELRTYSQRRSLTVEEYDRALTATKILKKVLPNATLFYCWVEGGGLHEEQVC